MRQKKKNEFNAHIEMIIKSPIMVDFFLDSLWS